MYVTVTPWVSYTVWSQRGRESLSELGQGAAFSTGVQHDLKASQHCTGESKQFFEKLKRAFDTWYGLVGWKICVRDGLYRRACGRGSRIGGRTCSRPVPF